MDERVLSQWFRVLGYGNPHASLWFVGIEPGHPNPDDYRPASSPPHPGMDKFAFGGAEYLYDANASVASGEKVSRAWSRPLAFARRVFGLSASTSLEGDSAWGQCMLSNLAPLPRPTEKHPLGVEATTYRERVKNERIPLFSRLLTEGPARAMVVHGKGAAGIYGADQQLGWGELQIAPSTEGRVRYRKVDRSIVVFCHSLIRARNSDLDAVCELIESVGLGR